MITSDFRQQIVVSWFLKHARAACGSDGIPNFKQCFMPRFRAD